MKVGVISDIHGNLPALHAIEPHLRACDQVICLGDIVNYGPWSNECLELILTLPMVKVVRGNHEDLFLGLESIASEIPLVQDFTRCCMPHFQHSATLAKIPMELSLHGWLFTHTVAHLKIYPDTIFDPPCDCWVGHTHHAFDRMCEGKRVVNPGSVGQNRKRLDIACWATLDTDLSEVTLLQNEYDAEPLIQEMKQRHYPESCLSYYLSKL